MKHNSPCHKCPNKGCGKHSDCAAYMEYYNTNRARNRENKLRYESVNTFIFDCVQKEKQKQKKR